MTELIYAGLPKSDQMKFTRHLIRTPEAIISLVCEASEVTRDQIVGPSRKRDIVEARHIAIGLILRSFRQISLTELGRIFNRDHSTIIYARGTFQDLMETSREFREKVASIKL